MFLCIKIESLLLDGTLNDYEFVKNSNKNIDDVDDAVEFKDLCVSNLYNFILLIYIKFIYIY